MRSYATASFIFKGNTTECHISLIYISGIKNPNAFCIPKTRRFGISYLFVERN